MSKIKIIGFVIVGVIVGLLLSAVLSPSVSNTGGVYSNVIQDFSAGISVDGTVVIDGSGNIDAPITSSTGTFSSTLAVTGVTTLTSQLNVTEATGTSTAYISATASNVGGLIILEDIDGAGCSEISALNGVLTAKTVTCP